MKGATSVGVWDSGYKGCGWFGEQHKATAESLSRRLYMLAAETLVGCSSYERAQLENLGCC